MGTAGRKRYRQVTLWIARPTPIDLYNASCWQLLIYMFQVTRHCWCCWSCLQP